MNRGRAKPSPGPPDFRGSAAFQPLSNGYLPLSRGGGRGGANESGEGQAFPRTPGFPRLGRIPMALSPC